MIEAKTIGNFFKEVGALTPSMSRYAAACGSFGGVIGLISPYLGIEPVLGFTLGFMLPLGPLVWLCNSDWWIRRDLARVQEWENQKLITAKEAESQRQAILLAMSRHRYGAKKK